MALAKLSGQQILYLLKQNELIELGQIPTLEQCCTAAKVHRSTVWRWMRDPVFLVALGRVRAAHVVAQESLVDLMVQRHAMRGNPIAIEAELRRRGRWDGGFDAGPLPAGSVVNAQAAVQFFNVPVPLTREQAERLRPAPGSSDIIPAPALPPMPVRPPK